MTKLKAIIAAVMVTLTAATMAACTEVSASDVTPPTFVQVESGGGWRIVYHSKTKVMYVVSDFYRDYGCVFTLLLNADGTPMTYSGDH
jgi:hypothetical protein